MMSANKPPAAIRPMIDSGKTRAPKAMACTASPDSAWAATAMAPAPTAARNSAAVTWIGFRAPEARVFLDKGGPFSTALVNVSRASCPGRCERVGPA